MSTAIMQTGAMGWDYKFHDWNDSNDGDIQLKVSINTLKNVKKLKVSSVNCDHPITFCERSRVCA